MTRWTALTWGLLGALLVAGSAGTGLLLDDYVHANAVRATLSGQSDRPWWDLFVVIDNADPVQFERRRAAGLLPWWSAPGVRVAFFRPVAALSHYLDQLVLRDAVWMHLQSIVWYGLLCALVALVYRRLMGPGGLSLLAALIFTVDDVHAIPAGWVANRNALLAGLGCAATLWAHHRWRADGWAPGAWIAPAALAGALLSAELGVGTLAFVLAYAVTLDRSAVGARLRSLVPALSVVLGWSLLHGALGYGSASSGSYVDPATAPLTFLSVLPERLGTLVALQFGLPLKAVIPLLDSIGGQLTLNGAWLCVVGAVTAAVVRGHREPLLRFWALAFVMSLVPLAAAVPGDRMLMLPSIAAAPLLAHAIAMLAQRVSCIRERVRVGLAALTAVIHLGFAPVCLAISAGPPDHLLGDQGPRASAAPAMGDGPEVAQLEVILVNPPDAVHPANIGLLREAQRLPMPRRIWVWAPTRDALDWRLIDPHTVELTSKAGLLDDIFSRNFRGAGDPLTVGHRVQLSSHGVEVMEVNPGGLPTRLRFRFGRPVAERTELRFLFWDGEEYRRTAPPADRPARLPATH